MPLINPDDLKIGQYIVFTSIEANDTISHSGKIKSIGDYDNANLYEHIAPRYEYVRRQIPTMAPKDKLTYFIIETYQDNQVGKYVIAKEWINPSSLQVLEPNVIYKINLYDTTQTRVQDAIDLLRANGFSCDQG